VKKADKARAPSLRLIIAAAVLAILWLAMLTVGTGRLDEQLLRILYAGGHPTEVTVARTVTFFGEVAVLLGISFVAACLLWARGRARDGIAILLVTLVGRALVEAQKYSIMRLRPEAEVHLVTVSTPSFPSGHASNSMIVYLTLALVMAAGRWKRPSVAAALLFSLCIGISRVMLGVHWPTDVIGGWTFGLLWVLLALPPAERLAHIRKIR
jgi:undecaprenyl-diphosphatase